mmetsp:Transcript_51633/g.58561  ORF Transcript_51633/g.58561 Transcript_51633/m.58561 type:complete len:97 (+) Transcript_51633:882-1172(+)
MLLQSVSSISNSQFVLSIHSHYKHNSCIILPTGTNRSEPVRFQLPNTTVRSHRSQQQHRSPQINSSLLQATNNDLIDLKYSTSKILYCIVIEQQQQ